MQVVQKASHFFILIPFMVFLVIFVAPTTTFAHAASGGPKRQVMTTTPASLCPDCEGKDPIMYRHNGAVCADDGRDVGFTTLRGGVLYLFYSDSCGTNWAVVSGDVGGLIENANVTR